MYPLRISKKTELPPYTKNEKICDATLYKVSLRQPLSKNEKMGQKINFL